MSSAVAWAGWALAVCLLLSARRRLALLADAAHELRGAATALGFAAERMRRAGATRAFAELVAVQLDRMGAGLLDLERSRRAPRLAPPGLRGARARAAVPREAGAAGADCGRLAQVVANLVANAAEHGRGPVEIRWSSTRSGARLEIRNSNRPRELHELAAAQRVPGRGRGVGIAHRAARELGGRLRVERGEEATVATLELPPESAGRAA